MHISENWSTRLTGPFARACSRGRRKRSRCIAWRRFRQSWRLARMRRAICSVCLNRRPYIYTKSLLTSTGYFEVLHPVYPFIDKRAFQEKAASSNLFQVLETDLAFCGLYYAVVALGCQYNGFGSFIPDNNRPWKFFQIALSRLGWILMSPESLVSLQVCPFLACRYISNQYENTGHHCNGTSPNMCLSLSNCRRPSSPPVHLATASTKPS
jgi:hypothetical protein